MSDKRKRNKRYYAQGGDTKRHKLNALEAGMRGFLLTCNNKEKGARREGYNLLNEYADTLFGAQKSDDCENSDDDLDLDLEAAVKKEVDAIKSLKPAEWRFKAVESGANNCVFISTTVQDPIALVHNVLSDAYDSGVSKTRYILRILPVAGSCRADEEHIRKLSKEILPQYFEQKLGVSYKVEVKIRNNQVSRHVIISTIGKVVQELNEGNKADLTKPEYVISVDVLRTVCCIGVLRDFQKFKKYNIQEVAKLKAQRSETEVKFENRCPDIDTVKTNQPDDTVKTNQPDDTVATNQPDDTVKTNQPDDTVKTNQPEDTVKTNQLDDTVKTNQPEDTAKTNQPDDTTVTIIEGDTENKEPKEEIELTEN